MPIPGDRPASDALCPVPDSDLSWRSAGRRRAARGRGPLHAAVHRPESEHPRHRQAGTAVAGLLARRDAPAGAGPRRSAGADRVGHRARVDDAQLRADDARLREDGGRPRRGRHQLRRGRRAADGRRVGPRGARAIDWAEGTRSRSAPDSSSTPPGPGCPHSTGASRCRGCIATSPVSRRACTW